MRNTGGDRSYVAEYTINAANTWEQKSVTVSGGLITAGTWNWTNGNGLSIGFNLYCGSTFQTTAGAWNTGNFFATANQVNVLDTIGNIFAITGVQLEVGSVATPFEHRPVGTELALCQRYFYRIGGVANGFPLINGFASASGQNPTNSISFPVEMRATPTATVLGSWQTSNCTGPTVSFISQHGAAIRVLSTTGPAECAAFPNSADDVITFAIEL